MPSYVPFIKHCRNRALRERAYRAYVTRASDGDFDNTAIIQDILKLRRELEALIRIDASQESAREMLEAAYYNVEELGRRMGDYASRIDHDPARLDAIQRRQDLLYRLKGKYGPELRDVLETGSRARAELDLLEGGGFERKALEKAEAEAREKLASLAAKVTRGRRKAADRLAGEVVAVLPALGLKGGRFDVALEPLAEPGPHGAERVEFLVAVNAGFEPKPLARVASGGELSRVMLALKTILARVDHVATLVFDEIDAGIGGRVAVQVGAKLREVAGHHQVFAITHLPQIASVADAHFRVEKIPGDPTHTRIGRLSDAERSEELEIGLVHYRDLEDFGRQQSGGG